MRYSKSVNGMSCKTRIGALRPSKVDVFISSDKLGDTMSVGDGETLITFKLNDLREILKLKGGNKKNGK